MIESYKLQPDKVVEYVRSLLGTPYVHQGRLPGIGIDCIGVISCAANHLGIPHTDNTCYRSRPTGVLVPKFIEAGLIRRDDLEVEPARILVFEFRKGNPQHIAVATSKDRMVHTHAGIKSVVEHQIDTKWRDRLHSVWEFPSSWQL